MKSDIVDILNNPEEYYPDNFNTAMRANAFLLGLCQEAAEEIQRLRNTKQAIHTGSLPAIKVQDLGNI
jgi:hypothetical protein